MSNVDMTPYLSAIVVCVGWLAGLSFWAGRQQQQIAVVPELQKGLDALRQENTAMAQRLAATDRAVESARQESVETKRQILSAIEAVKISSDASRQILVELQLAVQHLRDTKASLADVRCATPGCPIVDKG